MMLMQSVNYLSCILLYFHCDCNESHELSTSRFASVQFSFKCLRIVIILIIDFLKEFDLWKKSRLSRIHLGRKQCLVFD
jgi:hypothetical protein